MYRTLLGYPVSVNTFFMPKKEGTKCRNHLVSIRMQGEQE